MIEQNKMPEKFALPLADAVRRGDRVVAVQEFRKAIADAHSAGARGALHEFIARPDVPRDVKLEVVKGRRKEIREERVGLTSEMVRLEKQIVALTFHMGALEECLKWAEDSKKGYRFERVEISKFHKAVEYLSLVELSHDTSSIIDEIDVVRSIVGRAAEAGNVFLIQHDWADAFKNAQDFSEGEIHLPFEWCVFEARYGGRHIIHVTNEETAEFVTLFEASEHRWVWFSSAREERVASLMQKQIRAMCIALDAEIAGTEIIRAPHKLNRARIDRGRVPLFDFHIVNLAHRRQIINPSSGHGEPGHQKRLHFRRGHWRHYSEFKTWIRWTLVGNPDLGFIEKEYRL